MIGNTYWKICSRLNNSFLGLPARPVIWINTLFSSAALYTGHCHSGNALFLWMENQKAPVEIHR